LRTTLSSPVTSEKATAVAKAATRDPTIPQKKTWKAPLSQSYTLHFPPVELCTDNAAMIAWAGWEMYNAGWETELTVQPFQRWSLEAKKKTKEDESKMQITESKSTGKVEVVDDKPGPNLKRQDGWGILTVDGWKYTEPIKRVSKELTQSNKDYSTLKDHERDKQHDTTWAPLRPTLVKDSVKKSKTEVPRKIRIEPPSSFESELLRLQK